MRKVSFLLQAFLILLLSCNNNDDDSTNTSPNQKDSTLSSGVSNPVEDTAAAQAPEPSYPDISPALTMKTLWCNEKTEESGEDEIYLLLAGKKSDGTVIESRLPVGLTWSLSKSGGPANQAMEAKYNPGGFGIWSGSLKNGESVELTVVIMEEDRSSTGERMQAAARIAAATNPDDPTVGAGAAIVNFIGQIINGDTDDFPGAFSVKITNDKGNMKTEWQALDRCIDTGRDQNGKRFDVNGDGAYYMTTVDVK